MSKLLWLVGSTVGGALGWWLGQFFGTMTAYILSTIGTGLGILWARRYMAEHF
jgi:membrane protein YqaA with SNARE-associated domain